MLAACTRGAESLRVSFDGIRIVRAGLLIGWLVVSMLVVAGFAAFSADDETADPQQQVTLNTDVGSTAGAVAAMAFVGSASTLPPAEAPAAELDPTAPNSSVLAVAPPADEGSEKQGGVYVRSGYLSESEVRELISAHFESADVNRAIRVAWCASSFNPSSINPATGASGLFQHLPENWAEHSAAAGRPAASIFDPEANVVVAAWMLYELPGGWSHWDCAP